MKKPLKTSSKTAVKKISSPASAKPAAKPVAKAKPAAVATKLSKAAPAKPIASKPAPKAVAVKAPVKAIKPAPKPTVKPAPKAVAKAVDKASAKPASKPSAAPKVETKVAAKVAPKAASKVVAKAVVKGASQPVSKTPVPAPKNVPAKAVAVKAEIAEKPVKAEKPTKVEKAVKADKAPVVVVTPALPEAPVAAGDVPARAVRPSARLAQITVPSMAQSVASTAAKASYLQNMPTQVLTPPPFVAVKKDPKLANNWKTKKPDQLTDAEVMAMSDNDYMNDAQLAFFRLKLVHLKQGILANAGETTEHLREDTVVVPDPADRATIEEEHALELRTRDRERKLLKKIEQSIQRIDAGDYGYCDETGEPIGVGRLLARPTANLSLEAQQRRELKQKMFGD